MVNKIAAIFIVVLMVSCSADPEVKTNGAPVAKFTLRDQLDKIQLDGTLSTDPDNNVLAYTWTSSSANLMIQPTDLPEKSYFMLPQSPIADPVTITLKVTDSHDEAISTQQLTIPPLTESRAFGLGKSVTKEISLDQSYEWYMDQANTGPYSLVNCGPTSVTMAIKWAHPDFSGTPLDARNAYRSWGGWWYTEDIISYLRDQQVSTWTIALNGMQGLRSELDNGNIAILCLDMYSVPLLTQIAGSEFHKDKFYQTNAAGWGHFIVIKGYKEVDGTLYFEAFDPYSFGKQYTDLALKGRNRYYTGSSLDNATQIWWDFAIIISKDTTPGGRRSANEVNPGNIIHMPGQ